MVVVRDRSNQNMTAQDLGRYRPGSQTLILGLVGSLGPPLDIYVPSLVRLPSPGFSTNTAGVGSSFSVTPFL